MLQYRQSSFQIVPIKLTQPCHIVQIKVLCQKAVFKSWIQINWVPLYVHDYKSQVTKQVETLEVIGADTGGNR